MLSYFSEQLADNASRGLINRVADVKLLQGDLAEAWREGDTDRLCDRGHEICAQKQHGEARSGRSVEGGEQNEVTELWTFMRARWQLAALCHPADLMEENSSAVPANGIRRVAAALRQSDLARRRISNRATTSRWTPSQPHPGWSLVRFRPGEPMIRGKYLTSLQLIYVG